MSIPQLTSDEDEGVVVEDLRKRMQRLEDTFMQHELEERSWQSSLNEGLQTNTKLLAEMREIMELGKAFFAFTRGFAKLAAWLAPIVGAIVGVWAVVHGKAK